MHYSSLSFCTHTHKSLNSEIFMFLMKSPSLNLFDTKYSKNSKKFVILLECKITVLCVNMC